MRRALNRDPLRNAAGGRQTSRRGPHERSHHIADVAHHFLADARTEAPCIFVAGPAAGTGLALELAAGWARAAGGTVGFVDSAPAAAEIEAERLTGVVRRAPDDPDRPGESALFWHLGHPDRRRLDDLDAVGRVPGAGLPGLGRRRRILWCVAPGVADAWHPLIGLGRLTGALHTGGTALVVGPGNRAATELESIRARAGAAIGDDASLVILPEAARPGARAATLAGLPALLFPATP
ncbi:MAG: hypothetical protein GY838_06415 [bacterium]|nr:hypothetical protein [bacterium]